MKDVKRRAVIFFESPSYLSQQCVKEHVTQTKNVSTPFPIFDALHFSFIRFCLGFENSFPAFFHVSISYHGRGHYASAFSNTRSKKRNQVTQ